MIRLEKEYQMFRKRRSTIEKILQDAGICTKSGVGKLVLNKVVFPDRLNEEEAIITVNLECRDTADVVDYFEMVVREDDLRITIANGAYYDEDGIWKYSIFIGYTWTHYECELGERLVLVNSDV